MVLRFLRRAALALGLAVAALEAVAECRGPSLLERLDPQVRAELATRVAATPHGQGLLWSARRGGARILLAGTLHLPDPRHRATLLLLAPALREAGLVLLETTPAEEAAMERAIAASPGLAVATTAPFLSDRLEPAAWTAVAAAAQARGIAPSAAARFRPWLLMMALSTPPCAAPVPGERGLDRMILGAAQADGVPVAALEPWDTLFRAFGQADPATEIEMLKLSLLDPATSEELLVAMREGYFAGRVAEVWELSRLAARFQPEGLDADPAAFDRLEESLLTRRNRAWLPVIEAAAARNPRLVVAAGAAHLPGEGGVLRLLERAGWTVEPLGPETCCKGFWGTS